MRPQSLISLALLASLLAACGPPSITVKDDEGKEVKLSAESEGTVTITGADGKTVIQTGDGGESVDLSGLPGFIKQYPGAKATMLAMGAGMGNSGGMVGFETKDKPAVVYDWYKTQYAGASDVTTVQSAEGSMVSGTSAEGKAFTVTLNATGDGATNIAIMWGDK
jgi:ABC-type Fe3+-hydroxamate transport system substrate-binding protein